ncbi:HTH-type transcriptional regulator ArgP [Trinickia acidisoli]|uniref:HTH-type transcriptional regulator ArgP n=1 Tax=Trinickia acidisoli TaxID=2767482 RepID=UPI001A8EC9ED|nr:HTH-type transcriptional regulator ArgP [Trinickia acidisoli]
MLDRDQLEAFATVLKFRSFERAALHLNLSRGAVSQRIRALEECLSRELIVRSKPVAPTIHGEYLLRHVLALRLLESDTLRAIRGDKAVGGPVQIALGVDADSLSTWFQSVLSDIEHASHVSFEVTVDGEYNMTEMLRRGELLGCLSTSPTPSRGFSCDTLGTLRYRCVAEPRFAARAFPDGLDLPRALSTHAVVLASQERTHDAFLRKAFGVCVDNYPRHAFPSAETRLNAIRLGMGFGLAPQSQVTALLERGELVDLAPTRPFDVRLYWHQCIVDSALVDRVRASISARAKAHLEHDAISRVVESKTFIHDAESVPA